MELGWIKYAFLVSILIFIGAITVRQIIHLYPELTSPPPQFTYSATSNILDIGQCQNLNFLISDGAFSPYVYNLLIYNATGSLVYNSFYIFATLNQTNPINYSVYFLQQQNWGPGNFMANITIKNRFGKSSANSLTFLVNNALMAGNIIKSGFQLAANPSGGTPPYSYKWYSSNSPSCSPSNLIRGQTSDKYLASQASNAYYCYEVSDSANALVGNTVLNFSVFGDSIAYGSSSSTYPPQYAWPRLLAEDNRIRLIDYAASGRSLNGTLSASGIGFNGLISTLTSNMPNQIWIAIGINDWYGASENNMEGNYGTENLILFGEEYGKVLNGLNAVAPNAIIYAQTPILNKFDEGVPNKLGYTLQDYRNTIASLCAARSGYCVLVNGKQIELISDLLDGTHPSLEGAVKYWLYVKPIADKPFYGSLDTANSNTVEVTTTSTASNHVTISN
jgi:lysophospholipase L1-like esterase